MDFKKTLLLIVSLSCLLLHTNAASPGAASLRNRAPHIMVHNLCRNSTNPILCVQTILPQMKGPFKPYKALEAEILATRDQVMKTSNLISNHLANPFTPKPLVDSLTQCKEQYDNMLDSIQVSLNHVSRRDVIEAKYKFSSVLSYHASCNDAFGKGEVSPIAYDAKLVYDLGGNCLDIMKEIEDRELRRVKRRFGNKFPPPPPAVSFANDPCFGVIGICLSA